MTNLPTVAVVLAGGSGARLDVGLPKQLLKLAGKPVIEHTLDALHECREIDEILVVMAADGLDQLDEIIAGRYPKIRAVIPGGADRNESTKRAIAALGARECKVLFHDAVRPFVDQKIVTDCVAALDRHAAVDVVIESADTIVVVDGTERIVEIPERRYLRRGQTPQGFLLSTIREAYARAEGDPHFSATDDCSVVLKYLPETTIQAVSGSEHNLKITYPLDMFIADKLFQLASTTSVSKHSDRYANLRGKTLVVFGGSYGIGAEVMRLFKAAGASTFSFSRHATGTDIRHLDAVEAALVEASEKTGRIDFVVNAAAILRRQPFMDMSVEDIEDQVTVNYLGPALIARASLPYLQRTRGHLLLFTSSSYTRGRADYSLYSSAKAAVVNLTQALADEWSTAGVRVNCINPERTRTPMRVRNFGQEPAGTLLEPAAVAQTVLEVLVSDLTGHVVDVRLQGPVEAVHGCDNDPPDRRRDP